MYNEWHDKRRRLLFTSTKHGLTRIKLISLYSDSKSSLKKVSVDKDSRLLVCHAGLAHQGYLEGARLIFQGKKEASTDDHQEMNSTIFKEYSTTVSITLLY